MSRPKATLTSICVIAFFGATEALGQRTDSLASTRVIRGTSPCGDVGDNDGLPLGFSRVRVTPYVREPVAIAFADDGRLFIGQRHGEIRIFANGELSDTPALAIVNIANDGEQGLHGFVLDPDFQNNGYFYVRYVTAEPRSRLSRFQLVGDVADLASELVLWEAGDTADIWHHGGTVAFGQDGKLYTSLGDNLDADLAQDPATFNGKILRINPDGSIPADNPFTNTPGTDPRVWAMGLRNPFRFSVDAQTGNIWIGDVGSGGPAGREEINLGTPAANYGWPNQEGDGCYAGDCAAYTTPVFAYDRSAEYSADELSAAIVMGPRYRAGRYPGDYDGSIFFADYSSNWIRRLVLRPDGTADRDEPFARMGTAGAIVDMKIGPDGWLYTVVIWSFDNALSPGIYRYEFDPNYDRPPVSLASADVVAGQPPLSVQFDGGQSFDPDGAAKQLGYCWDFGDGQTSDEVSPLHEYAAAGQYEVRLTVRSNTSGDVSDPIEIVVGHPPVCEIFTPKVELRYRAGQEIAFSGAAYDEEDGWLPKESLSWEVVMIHATHVHPFLGPLDGVREGTLTIPQEGHNPDDTHYRIRLTATDAAGLSTTVESDLLPDTAQLTIDTDPPGLAVFLDGAPTPTPRSFASLIGFHHHAEATAEIDDKGTRYRFVGWSNGGQRDQVFEMPADGLRLTANYEAILGDVDTTNESTASDRGSTCPIFGGVLLAIGLFGLSRTDSRRWRG